jgi:hypothetical protein
MTAGEYDTFVLLHTCNARRGSSQPITLLIQAILGAFLTGLLGQHIRLEKYVLGLGHEESTRTYRTRPLGLSSKPLDETVFAVKIMPTRKDTTAKVVLASAAHGSAFDTTNLPFGCS